MSLEDADIHIGVSTPRTAEFLVPSLGFCSLQHFSASIPVGAEVIDVGAGLSTLGHTMANIRHDIAWTNFDIRYERGGFLGDDMSRFNELIESAPYNLRYVPGNILEPPSEISNKRYARVISYFMVQYATASCEEAGRVAIENLLNLTAPCGTVSLGPISDTAFNSILFGTPSKSLHLEPPGTITGNAQLAAVIADALGEINLLK